MLPVQVATSGTELLRHPLQGADRPSVGPFLRRSWWRAAAASGLLAGIVLGVAALQVYTAARHAALDGRPVLAGLSVEDVLFDTSTLSIAVAAGGEHAPWRTTPRALVSSSALWRRMHLVEWNAVPGPLRARALENMLLRYRHLLMTPATWDVMTAADWDAVPQPMRTVAYRQMLAYWSGYYAVGERYALPRRQMAETLAAIVMSESWFDHRARYVNSHGNTDIGLAQASDFARERLRVLYERGLVDVALTDDDYLDPWKATRFVAIWMTLLLDEADGDLDLAIRAYNRGIARADDALGRVYHATVLQRLDRYIRNREAPAAWAYLWDRAAALERAEWPWTRRGTHEPIRTAPRLRPLPAGVPGVRAGGTQLPTSASG